MGEMGAKRASIGTQGTTLPFHVNSDKIVPCEPFVNEDVDSVKIAGVFRVPSTELFRNLVHKHLKLIYF